MTGVELATAYISIVPEGSRIAPEVKRQFGQVGVEADRAGKASGKRFGGSFGSSLKLLGGAAVGAGIVSFFKDAVGGASDLNESTTKISAIFGNAQGAVQDFASQGAKALGQTKLEVLDAAASFGTFGKAAGLQGPKLAKFSTGFASLSTDLASFFNTDPSQAAEAIGAALRGEAEPIRQFGVLLDDATLRNEALRLGLIKTTKTALTPQQKVLAAQAAIYRQTKDAQGDFQRTSGGLANQQRILKAQLSDVRSELGTKLLPVATKVVSKTSELVDEFQNGTGAGGEIRDVLEDIVGVGKGVLKFFNALPGPVKKFGAEGLIAVAVISKLRSGLVGPLAGALSTFSTSMTTATTRTEKFKTGLRGLGSGLTNVAGAGGMLLLADSAGKAGTGLGVLESAAGGALSGAALGAFGGPLGAAIGAGIGGIAGGAFAMARGTQQAGDAARDAAPKYQSFVGALTASKDAMHGLLVETAQVNLSQGGPNSALAAAREIGITTATAVKAALGDAKAIAAINKAISREIKAGTLDSSSFKLLGSLSANTKLLKAQTIETNEALLAQGKYNQVLAGVPKNVQTRVDQIGIEKAEANIVGLTKKYDLTPKQIDTILRASGTKKTADQIAAIKRQADNAAKDRSFTVTAKPGPKLFLTDLLGPGVASQLPGISGRATGGPVQKGQPYIVGERRPELFIPNQPGRIVPRVPASNVASGPISFAGQRLTLNIAGRQIEGVIEELAAAQVDSAAYLNGQRERAL